MNEPIPEQIRAYHLARVNAELGLEWLKTIADDLRDTTAALMRSEFMWEHHRCETFEYVEGVAVGYVTHCDDPRHLFKFEQWQSAADKLLKGDG